MDSSSRPLTLSALLREHVAFCIVSFTTPSFNDHLLCNPSVVKDNAITMDERGALTHQLPYRIYSRERFMNPGPAPRPPTDRPRLNLTPEVNNVPGNMSALKLNSINSANSSTSSPGVMSTTSLPLLQRAESSAGALSVLKEGTARVREDGIMKFWSEKWLVLREAQLDFHKSSNSPKISLSIALKDVTGVGRSESTSVAFEISRLVNPALGRDESNIKRVMCKVETDDEVYSWTDSIQELCPNMGGVSNPTNFAHQVHVGFDPTSGAFVGLPPEWEKLLTNSAISKEDYQKNPTAVIEVLNFYTNKLQDRRENPTYPAFQRTASADSAPKPRSFINTGSSGANVTPPRPKPPAGISRQDSYEPTQSSRSSPIDRRAPSHELPPTSQPDKSISEARAEKERLRKAEEDARRERMAREQRERDRYRENERLRREREEQQAYNNSLPKTKQPLAKQEVGGYSGGPSDDQKERWNPSRQPPQPPVGARDRNQAPQGSLRQQPPHSRPAPPAPATHQNGAREGAAPRPYAQQQRQQSPAKPNAQPNGASPASTRIPVKPAQDPSAQRRPDQGGASGQPAAPKPLNVTVKQPTGAAAVAEAATKLEAGPPPKAEQKREGRMSNMSEAEVMARLREVVSKDAPLASYNKQRKIGQGASGSVYVAKIKENAPSSFARHIVREAGPRQQVAIKQMDLRNQPRKELIVNEIVVMKDSKHPNIVNFIEAFLPEEQMELWVVMEFMEGGPLTDVIDNNPSIAEDQIATICLEVSWDLSSSVFETFRTLTRDPRRHARAYSTYTSKTSSIATSSPTTSSSPRTVQSR